MEKQLASQEPNRYPKELFTVLQSTWVFNTVEWLDHYAKRDWTLTHMDYELDNVLIDDDGPIVIDWQSPMISHPGVDLAWLLTSHTEETLAVEEDFLKLYRDTLSSSGGPSWSAEELRRSTSLGESYIRYLAKRFPIFRMFLHTVQEQTECIKDSRNSCRGPLMLP